MDYSFTIDIHRNILRNFQKTETVVWGTINNKQHIFFYKIYIFHFSIKVSKSYAGKGLERLFLIQDMAIFTGKHLCWILFSTKLRTFRPATLLKEDSNTSVFLWILQKIGKNNLEKRKKKCYYMLFRDVFKIT